MRPVPEVAESSASRDDLCPSRRGLLRAAAGLTLLPGVLVACSSDDPDGSGGSDAASTSSGSGGSVPVADVPVGTAAVVRVGDRSVVVAQPSAGEFVAFSATCTHQGTVVTVDSGTMLVCPSHGSRFDAADGSVTNGPATRALEPVPVSADGESLVVG